MKKDIQLDKSKMDVFFLVLCSVSFRYFIGKQKYLSLIDYFKTINLSRTALI